MNENQTVEINTEVTEEKTVFTAIEEVKAAVQETREAFAKHGYYSSISSDYVLRGLEQLCDILLTGGDVAELLKEYGVGGFLVTSFVDADEEGSEETPAEAEAAEDTETAEGDVQE